MATNLAKAYVQIVPSAEGMKGMIEQAMGKDPEEAGEKVGNSIASKIKNIIVAAGIGKVVSQAFTEGSALEQSLGGIETLYKENADKMKAYAKEAYKTSGVSANAYMENVTSFSASLISSLKGDTSKAADIANRAMQDMSDNSNKFGTNIQDIQNAYQGFAKQNYTMLDNLKLGYGGTKEEMQRLLKDAQKLSGQKYDISNLADVYTAIGVIQDNLGITGTTAKEAATTFSGSFGSMKAAAQDFLGNVAIGGDVTGTLSNLITTASTFLFDNAVPMALNIVQGFATGIKMIIGNKEFGNHTYVMGILNVTPDSFSDGGKFNNIDSALKHTEQLINDGADIIDVGGESTRPNYTKISDEEEIERVVPVIEKIKADFDVPVSIDTYKSKVAAAAVGAGADLVNDIWGLKYDKNMAEVIAKSGAACCLMHNRERAEYNSFVEDVLDDLRETIAIAKKAGIADDKIILDPGVGFAKSYEQNLIITNNVDRLNELGYPVLLGTSRKSMIGLTLDLPSDQRVEGTVATSVIGVMKGCRFVRVHDVLENKRAILMTEAIINS